MYLFFFFILSFSGSRGLETCRLAMETSRHVAALCQDMPCPPPPLEVLACQKLRVTLQEGVGTAEKG